METSCEVVVKLYFPKYIDKVVIIEIKQTCHTVLVTLGGYFNMFLFVLKTFSGWRLEKWSVGDGVS